MEFKVLYEEYNMVTVTQQIQARTGQYSTAYKTSQTECNNKMQRLVAQCLGSSILLGSSTFNSMDYRQLHIKTQSVPRSKYTISRL